MGIAVLAPSFKTALPQQILWYSIVEYLEHLVLGVLHVLCCCLLNSPDESERQKMKKENNVSSHAVFQI